MEPEKIRSFITKLIGEVEEEDVGISLLSRYCQNKSELAFFDTSDQEKVLKILGRLAQDSERHKCLIMELVQFFEGQLHGS